VSAREQTPEDIGNARALRAALGAAAVAELRFGDDAFTPDEELEQHLGFRLGPPRPEPRGLGDVERAAIENEPPAAIGAAVAELRALRTKLAAPGTVAQLETLDTIGETLSRAAEEHQRRRDLARIGEIAGELRSAPDPVRARAYIIEARAIAAKLGPAPQRDRFSALDALDTNHEIPFLVRALQLAPGRPSVLAGYAGDGKTTAAISAALAWAIGRHAWSCEELVAERVPRVALVDLDTGVAAALARVNEVLRAEMVTREDLDGAIFDIIDGRRRALRLRCSARSDMPSEEDERAYLAAWRAMLAEYDLVIVDNLRKLAPRLNFDNDPRAAIVLDLLGEASGETGGIPWVLAHTPKGTNRGPHQAIKGKADLEGAAGAVCALWRDDEQRRHLELARGVELRFRPLVGYLDKRESGAIEFTRDDAAAKPAGADKPKKTSPEAREAARAAARDAAAEPLIPAVVKAVLGKKKRGASARDLRELVSGSNGAIDRARALACDRGLLVARAVGTYERYFAPSFAPPEQPEQAELPSAS
jgi:hypothetical protein